MIINERTLTNYWTQTGTKPWRAARSHTHTERGVS